MVVLLLMMVTMQRVFATCTTTVLNRAMIERLAGRSTQPQCFRQGLCPAGASCLGVRMMMKSLIGDSTPVVKAHIPVIIFVNATAVHFPVILKNIWVIMLVQALLLPVSLLMMVVEHLLLLLLTLGMAPRLHLLRPFVQWLGRWRRRCHVHGPNGMAAMTVCDRHHLSMNAAFATGLAVASVTRVIIAGVVVVVVIHIVG